MRPQIYDSSSHEWLGAVAVEEPPAPLELPPVPAAPLLVPLGPAVQELTASIDAQFRRVQVTAAEPLPPPVGSLARNSDQFCHQLFCIL